MADHYILSAAGLVQPADLLTWARWFETANRSVALTPIADGVQVSTVFLGLDHCYTPGGTPILWETLVFGGPLDGEMYRYESRLQAVQGHEAMVARVRASPGAVGATAVPPLALPTERRIDLEDDSEA